MRDNKRGPRKDSGSRGGGGSGFKGSDSGFGGGFRHNFNRERSFGGPREMHKATCADCGAECEVPFEPKEGRPVYCKDCFQKHKPKRF